MVNDSCICKYLNKMSCQRTCKWTLDVLHGSNDGFVGILCHVNCNVNDIMLCSCRWLRHEPLNWPGQLTRSKIFKTPFFWRYLKFLPYAKVYFILYLMKFKHVPLPAQHLGMCNIWNIYWKMSSVIYKYPPKRHADPPNLKSTPVEPSKCLSYVGWEVARIWISSSIKWNRL